MDPQTLRLIRHRTHLEEGKESPLGPSHIRLQQDQTGEVSGPERPVMIHELSLQQLSIIHSGGYIILTVTRLSMSDRSADRRLVHLGIKGRYPLGDTLCFWRQKIVLLITRSSRSLQLSNAERRSLWHPMGSR